MEEGPPCTGVTSHREQWEELEGVCVPLVRSRSVRASVHLFVGACVCLYVCRSVHTRARVSVSACVFVSASGSGIFPVGSATPSRPALFPGPQL